MENKYYDQTDLALKRYEDFKYPTRSIEWICDRINWCWRFRKISHEQMEELADRAILVMKMNK